MQHKGKRMMGGFLLGCALLLAACGAEKAETPPVPTEVPATQAPTPSPEPSRTPALVRADGAGACCFTLQRGDTVQVVGEQGSYYEILAEDCLLLAEKRFIRLEGAAAPAEYSAYTQCMSRVYATAYCTQELKTLATNTTVTVLDCTEGLCYVRVGSTAGYMRAESLGTERVESVEESKGGISEYAPEPSPTPEPTGMTGARGSLKRLSAGHEAVQTGLVFTDGLELYTAVYRRGDTVELVASNGESATVLENGRLCSMPALLLTEDSLQQTEESLQQTEESAYTLPGAVLYEDWRLTARLTLLQANSSIQVLEDFGSFVLVRTPLGGGYLSRELLSAEPVAAEHTGGTADNGDTGGSSSDGVWTDPVL